MHKLIALSDSEALIVSTALSHWAYHCSQSLPDADKHTCEILLDDLDVCDHLRKKLNNTFDFSKSRRGIFNGKLSCK